MYTPYAEKAHTHLCLPCQYRDFYAEDTCINAVEAFVPARLSVGARACHHGAPQEGGLCASPVHVHLHVTRQHPRPQARVPLHTMWSSWAEFMVYMPGPVHVAGVYTQHASNLK